MSIALSAQAALDHLPAHDDAPWLGDRRAAAKERLERGGFPATRDERWKGTDVAAFVNATAAPAPADVTAMDLEPFRFGAKHVAVMVDGAFQPQLSTLDGLPHEVHLEGLAAAAARGGNVLDEHLNALPRDDPFADWNMTAWTDGIFLTTAANVEFQEPIHILHVRTAQADTVAFPRVLVHLRDNASVQIVEHHVSLADVATRTVAVTELVAHAGARLQHHRIQEEARSALHLHAIYARADRDATIERSDACLGGARSRLGVDTVMQGQGAHMGMSAFFLMGGHRRTDVWTRFEHAAPNTTSREMVKGVVGDEARGAFTGNVLVQQVAQKTSAEQENRNLILSRKALVDAQPQLEIHADDVQCSHGSTVGQLDEDALFFLRARGIGVDEARLLLTKAFLGDVVDAMHPLIRDGINHRIDAWFEAHPQTVETLA